ncbi:MAG: ParB/RepB/Spo0J family partition protein [Armatimonadaceae bacterium]
MNKEKPATGQRKVLGRGLADLLPDGGDAEFRIPPGTTIVELPVAKIQASPTQPRTHFDPRALDELAESIRANGVLQPILVRPATPGSWEIVAGERRYRAALKVGLQRLPVIVKELADDEALAIGLIENLVREDIGPLETARAYRRLMDEFAWSQEDMGRRVGKSRSAIANSLRLLELPAPILESLDRGELTEGHARALLGDRSQRQTDGFTERQDEMFQAAVQGKATVRDIERRMAATTARRKVRETGADFSGIEDLFRRSVGTRVRLVGDSNRGKIEIHYYSAEELDSLLGRFQDLG